MIFYNVEKNLYGLVVDTKAVRASFHCVGLAGACGTQGYNAATNPISY